MLDTGISPYGKDSRSKLWKYSAQKLETSHLAQAMSSIPRIVALRQGRALEVKDGGESMRNVEPTLFLPANTEIVRSNILELQPLAGLSLDLLAFYKQEM